MGALSHELLDRGFFSALGTTERASFPNGGYLVEHKGPYTWDTNNGVLVVYDEEGRPWLRRTMTSEGQPFVESDAWRKICSCVLVDSAWSRNTKPELTRGAYVPHSNDGGLFLKALELLFQAGKRELMINR